MEKRTEYQELVGIVLVSISERGSNLRNRIKNGLGRNGSLLTTPESSHGVAEVDGHSVLFLGLLSL